MINQIPHGDPVLDNLDRFTNRMLHGDCLQLLRCLPDACADMVLTDPPYLVRYKDRAGRSIANDDNTRWMFPAFAEMFRVLKPNSYCVSFYGWSKADRFLSVWRVSGQSKPATKGRMKTSHFEGSIAYWAARAALER